MTLFEIIIICIVATMFVATIFMFTIYIKNIKKVNVLESKVIAMSNVAFECRCFLEKLSKHDVITKINNISGLEKKIGEVIGICKNQTNNITQVKDNLDKSLEDIKMRNNLIKDNHKLLDNINVKTSKMKDDIDKIGGIFTDINKSNVIKYDKMVDDITYIREKLGETSVDSEKYVNNINEKLEEILSWNRRCRGGIETLTGRYNKDIDTITKNFKTIDDKISNICPNINKNIFTSYEDIKEKLLKIDQQYTIITNNIDSLIKGHNKAINALEQSFEVVNTKNDVISNAIDKTYNDIKSILKDIAKIGSILDSYREKVNYIATWIENATKLKTATKTKSIQTKTTKTPIIKK